MSEKLTPAGAAYLAHHLFCCHQAAHAVVGWQLRIPCCELTTQARRGCCALRSTRGRSSARSQLLFLLAGMAYETCFGFQADWSDPAATDWLLARELLAESDPAVKGHEAVDLALRPYIKDAALMLFPYIIAVGELATRLEERRAVSRVEVEQYLLEAGVRPRRR